MASLNKVLLIGNLTRDPDLRGLPNGQSVCELRLAMSRRFQNSSGQEVEDTCFIDVVVWGRTANNCKQFLAKGSPVFVEGRLQLDQWEDRNGGGQRSRIRVVAEQIQFLLRRSDVGQGGPNGAPGYYNNQPGGYQAPNYGQQANYGGQGNNYRPNYGAVDNYGGASYNAAYGAADNYVNPGFTPNNTSFSTPEEVGQALQMPSVGASDVPNNGSSEDDIPF